MRFDKNEPIHKERTEWMDLVNDTREANKRLVLALNSEYPGGVPKNLVWNLGVFAPMKAFNSAAVNEILVAIASLSKNCQELAVDYYRKLRETAYFRAYVTREEYASNRNQWRKDDFDTAYKYYERIRKICEGLGIPTRKQYLEIYPELKPEDYYERKEYDWNAAWAEWARMCHKLYNDTSFDDAKIRQYQLNHFEAEEDVLGRADMVEMLTNETRFRFDEVKGYNFYWEGRRVTREELEAMNNETLLGHLYDLPSFRTKLNKYKNR